MFNLSTCEGEQPENLAIYRAVSDPSAIGIGPPGPFFEDPFSGDVIFNVAGIGMQRLGLTKVVQRAGPAVIVSQRRRRHSSRQHAAHAGNRFFRFCP